MTIRYFKYCRNVNPAVVRLLGGTPLRTVIGVTRYRRTKAGTGSDRARTLASQLLFRELSLAQAGHSANGTLRGIGLDSEIVQVLCKAAAPFAESGLFDIESLTLFTHGFDDDVRLRMGFVGMERHDVAVLQRKFFAAEVSDGPEDIFPKASRLV